MNEPNQEILKQDQSNMSVTRDSFYKTLQINIIIGSVIIGGAIIAATYLYTESLKTKEQALFLPQEEESVPQTNQLGTGDVPIQNPPSTLDTPYENAPVVTEETIVFPPGSAYRYEYGSLYYTPPGERDADYKYLSIDKETFEYINEDIVKDSQSVYYKGEYQRWVTPVECTRENLNGCVVNTEWMKTVTPYPLEIDWSGSADDAVDILPSVGPMCLDQGYRVGTVKNGPLTGSPFFVQSNSICDMWCGGLAILDSYHFVKYQGSIIPISESTGFSVPELATSSKTDLISIPGSALSLKREGTAGLFLDESKQRKFLFNDPTVGEIYRDDYSCFSNIRPDRIEVAYSLELPFNYDRSDGSLPYTKLDGSQSDEVYKAYRDYSSCLKVVDKNEMSSSRLIKAGDLANGDELYKIVDSSDEKLLELYENKNTLASYESGQNKYSYDQFLAYNPYLYWKDPFGDWVELLNRRFDIAAEKCKPVIYLYPEAEGNFSVQVAPNGGFTETIPVYESGWNVTATPNSVITDKKSGETYPYLYWEGITTGIPLITEGWVVSTENLDSFLSEKLTRLGLSEKERADFKEYWIPRLEGEGARKYKIMFLSKEQFDVIAPLSVSGDETPRNVIRVTMYAQEAQTDEILPPQTLPPTPTRSGFTVVEWGGSFLN